MCFLCFYDIKMFYYCGRCHISGIRWLFSFYLSLGYSFLSSFSNSVSFQSLRVFVVLLRVVSVVLSLFVAVKLLHEQTFDSLETCFYCAQSRHQLMIRWSLVGRLRVDPPWVGVWGCSEVACRGFDEDRWGHSGDEAAGLVSGRSPHRWSRAPAEREEEERSGRCLVGLGGREGGSSDEKHVDSVHCRFYKTFCKAAKNENNVWICQTVSWLVSDGNEFHNKKNDD